MPAATEAIEFLGLRAVFHSQVMCRLLSQVQRYAQSPAAVLIQGESGTGKEVVARAVHHFSPRGPKPWVDVSCGALPDQLMESELFGYEKGAFSGAMNRKEGLFEMADGGTLFLDEIGELDPRMQVKLLRVLDGGSYYRLGGTRKVTVNVRIVAATNRDLAECVEKGEFRRDLYHRLAQLQVMVPALRHRPEDIAPLAEFFLRQYTAKVAFSREAMEILEGYAWPGNVRELRNVVMSGAVTGEGEVVEAEDLPAILLARRNRTSVEVTAAPMTMQLAVMAHHQNVDRHNGGVLESAERELILRVLGETHGHQENAARILGISSRTLSRKLKAYQVELRSPEKGDCATA